MALKAAYTNGLGVTIEGLDDLMAWLKESDPKMKRALTRALKDAAKPVLSKARANGRAIQDDGTYAESLTIGSRKSGTQYVLKSTDPAAGVKEFAKPGAVRLSRSSTQRARQRAGLSTGGVRVGVPHRANPPRVMVAAVEDSTQEIIEGIDAALADVIAEVANG